MQLFVADFSVYLPETQIVRQHSVTAPPELSPPEDFKSSRDCRGIVSLEGVQTDRKTANRLSVF
jgi:hypothetical protein